MYTELTQAELLLALMHYDIARADRLVCAVVVDHRLSAGRVFRPDLDAESVWGAISSPELELIGVAVGVKRAIDRATAFKLGIGTSLVNYVDGYL